MQSDVPNEVKTIIDYMIRNEGLPGPDQTLFGHLPPNDRLEIFKHFPVDQFNPDLVTLFMTACGEAGEVQMAISFANFFLDKGVISNFQYGGIQAIVESPYRRAEGRYKTIEKAMKRLEFEKDPFAVLLKEYCKNQKS